MRFIKPTRSTTTRRSAPAISTPRLKALRTTAKNVKRTKAMAKDPTVKIRRIFLRNRFARISRLNFMPHLRPERSGEKRFYPRPARLFQDAASYGRALRQLGRV